MRVNLLPAWDNAGGERTDVRKVSLGVPTAARTRQRLEGARAAPSPQGASKQRSAVADDGAGPEGVSARPRSGGDEDVFIRNALGEGLRDGIACSRACSRQQPAAKAARTHVRGGWEHRREEQGRSCAPL